MVLGPEMPPMGSPKVKILAIDIVHQKMINTIKNHELFT